MRMGATSHPALATVPPAIMDGCTCIPLVPEGQINSLSVITAGERYVVQLGFQMGNVEKAGWA